MTKIVRPTTWRRVPDNRR